MSSMTSDRSRLAPNQQWFTISIGAVLACIIAALVPYYYLAVPPTPEVSTGVSYPKIKYSGQDAVCVALAAALPDSVYSEHHPTFNQSVNSFWSLNACESEPTCIVQPASTQEVAATVEVLKSYYDVTKDSATPVKFAVRSGGHSPEAGFSSVDGGVLIDMGLMNEITVSDDRQRATLGVGARWLDVSSKLDSMGLAIVGGRDAKVGVGGFILGGMFAASLLSFAMRGISFFSPRYGLACDNVDEYEIVLANGTIAQVTSSQHADLWRALKGGTGNFGIVTRVTARTLVAGSVWAGYAFWPGWQTRKVLSAFVDFNQPENFDEYAAAPILAIGYIQKIGFQLCASSLVYTKPEKWAPVFKGFNLIWRIWSTAKVQSLTEATQELARMAPNGLRQFQATTTVKNDLDTLNAFYDIYNEKLKEVKNVKDLTWSFVFQPLSAPMTRKGNPNVLGLDVRHSTDTLVVALISLSWSNAKDDQLLHRVARELISESRAVAQEKGTADDYVYLNYAASDQDPFSGYGATNKEFLRDTSRAYDPDGLFQRAKYGGFKLDLY